MGSGLKCAGDHKSAPCRIADFRSVADIVVRDFLKGARLEFCTAKGELLGVKKTRKPILKILEHSLAAILQKRLCLLGLLEKLVNAQR